MDLTQRARAVLSELDAVATALVATIWGRLPGYEPIRMDVEDLVAVVQPNLRAILTALAEHRAPHPQDLEHAATLGERRAVQGVPIEGVVASWHIAERMLLQHLASSPPPVDARAVSQINQALAHVIDAMIEASTDAYRRTRSESAGHLDQIATDLVSRLAGGEPLDPVEVEERARLVGIATQVPHRAAAIGMRESKDPIALTRAQRVVLDSVRPRLSGRVLAGSKGSILLVVTADSPELLNALDRAARRPGVPTSLVIGLGEPRPRLGEVGGSCREALRALEAGLRMHTDAKVVPFRRVIAEVLLLDSPLDAQQLVDAVLSPLRSRPNLVTTLDTYLSAGLSVRATAQTLGVHENTVAYRLRRIVGLLGLTGPSDLIRADVLLAIRAQRLGL